MKRQIAIFIVPLLLAACAQHVQSRTQTTTDDRTTKAQGPIEAGSTVKRAHIDSLAWAVEILSREWFQGQVGDLPPNELPDKQEMEDDIADMRDDILRRVDHVLSASDAVKNGEPNDLANRAAIVRLVEEYSDLDQSVPIFTKLALSKVNDPAYRSGWRLCAIRIIAETYLPEARNMKLREP
jgi:hypothetical protein